jgi:hypothetical protein
MKKAACSVVMEHFAIQRLTAMDSRLSCSSWDFIALKWPAWSTWWSFRLRYRQKHNLPKIAIQRLTAMESRLSCSSWVFIALEWPAWSTWWSFRLRYRQIAQFAENRNTAFNSHGVTTKLLLVGLHRTRMARLVYVIKFPITLPTESIICWKAMPALTKLCFFHAKLCIGRIPSFHNCLRDPKR